MSKSILKVSVIGSFTLFESKIPLNEQMTLVEHPLNFLIFLTLKSSSRNDKSILHIDRSGYACQDTSPRPRSLSSPIFSKLDSDSSPTRGTSGRVYALGLRGSPSSQAASNSEARSTRRNFHQCTVSAVPETACYLLRSSNCRNCPSTNRNDWLVNQS